MKIKVIDLYNSLEAINEISNSKLSAKLLFSFLNFKKEVDDKISPYITIRDTKIKEYGALKEDGVTYEIDKDRLDSFKLEMEALESEEIELADYKIKSSDIEDIKFNSKALYDFLWAIDVK